MVILKQDKKVEELVYNKCSKTTQRECFEKMFCARKSERDT